MAGHDDLRNFVKEALGRGAGKREVENVLVQSGWTAGQTRAALAEFAEVEFPIPVPRPRPYVSARDAFLYLVLFSTLYISAFNAGNLVFEYINRWFPDPAFGARGPWVLASIRWSLASLIVAVPVFLFVSYRTQRAKEADAARRGSSVRRWLTYLTLTIASSVLIGDFITLVYNVLSGELSERFVLKVVTVAVIAGAVFFYYLWDVKADGREE